MRTVLVLLLVWLATQAGCSGAIAEASERGGYCAARCALSCALSWVVDLLPASEAVASEVEPGDLPGVGAELAVPVADRGGTTLVRGGLAEPPIHVGGGSYVVRLTDDQGPPFLVPLCREPRAYCASPIAAFADGRLPEPRPAPLDRGSFGALPRW